LAPIQFEKLSAKRKPILNKSKRQKSLAKETGRIEKEIRRARIGGQSVQIAGNDSILVGGNITNSNIISYRGIDEERLSELLHTVEQQIARDKYSRALQKYLKDLAKYCDDLPYSTLFNPTSETLSKIYVPTKFLIEGQTEQEDSISLKEILSKNEAQHILLTGEPGSGKSTVLRQIARYAWSEPAKIGLKESYLPLLLPLHIFSKLHFSLQERIKRTLDHMEMLEQSLPEDFFPAWAEKEQTKWLFLLDGLDEVPTDERMHLFKVIKDLMLRENCLVIITSRPSGCQADELDEGRLVNYVLQPFSPGQVKEFAENWFAEKNSHFLRSLEDLRMKTIYESPLLLTIAAKVYLERTKENGTGSLPVQRVNLYEEFVDICLEEARQRGLPDDLGDKLTMGSKYGLAHLAWEMTRRPGHDSEDELAQAMTDYLHRFQAFGEDEARTLGRRFLNAMGRRSGIFVKEGKTFNWLHPTFREYLAGWQMVEKEIDQLDIDDYDAPKVYYRFIYPEWKESTLFAIEILASRGEDVTPWVNGFYKARGPLDGGEALSALGKVVPELAKKIIEELSSLARGDWRGGKSVALLGNLCVFYPQAKDALIHLIYEYDLADGLVCNEAIIQLGKAGHADILLNLARDTQLHPYLRKDAALALTKIPDQTDKAARACLAIAHDDRFRMQDEDGRKMTSEHYIKLDVVKALADLPGWSKEAASLSLEMIRDESLYGNTRRESVEILGKAMQFDKLIEVAQDININLELRMRAVVHILEGEFQQAGDSQPTYKDMHEREEWLIDVANDERENLHKRFWAALKTMEYRTYYGDRYLFDATLQVVEQGIIVAKELASSQKVELFLRKFASEIVEIWSGVIPEFLEFIHDKENNINERIRIVRQLSLTGRGDILLDLIHNKDIESKIRLAAASFFVENKFTKEDSSLESMLALARDNQTDKYIRFSAAMEPFKTFDEDARSEALDILLALLAEAETDISLLMEIVTYLEVLGDAHCLPELERTMQQYPNEDIKIAAGQAIQQIRGREKPQEQSKIIAIAHDTAN